MGYRIDVRGIVLNIVGANPEAYHAYMHDPAMRHGVEVTIGVLGRAADVLTTTGGHSHPEAAELIREIAIACSHRGGPEDERAIAAAETVCAIAAASSPFWAISRRARGVMRRPWGRPWPGRCRTA